MRYFFPIILIIAAVGIFFGYTDQHYRDLRVQMDTLSHIDQAKKNALALNEQRDKLINERKKISDIDLKRIEKMIPDSVENVGLIIEINNIALKNGMSFVKNPRLNEGATNAGAASGPDASKYGSISMSFNVSGSYQQFQAFLKELESYIRLVDVTALSFASAKDNNYDFNITLQTYWLK